MRNLANGGDDRFASHLSRIMHSIIGRALHTHTHTHTHSPGDRWRRGCVVFPWQGELHASRTWYITPECRTKAGQTERARRKEEEEEESTSPPFFPSCRLLLFFFLFFFFFFFGLVLDEWQKQSEVGDLRLQPPLSWRHKKKKKKHRVKFIHPPLQLIFFEWLTEAMHTFSHKTVMNKITHTHKKICDGGEKRNSRPARILQWTPKTFYLSYFFLSLWKHLGTFKKKKKSVEREKGRKLSINRKSNFCWCAPGCSEVPGRANRLSLQVSSPAN